MSSWCSAGEHDLWGDHAATKRTLPMIRCGAGRRYQRRCVRRNRDPGRHAGRIRRFIQLLGRYDRQIYRGSRWSDHGSTIDSDSSIYASSGGNQSFTDLDAGTSIYQRAVGTITQNDLRPGRYRRRFRRTMASRSGRGWLYDLRSTTAPSACLPRNRADHNFVTGGTLTGLTMTAGNSLLAQSGGAIQLGAITAGITNKSSATGANYRWAFRPMRDHDRRN